MKRLCIFLICAIVLFKSTETNCQKNKLIIYTAYSQGKVDKRIDFLFDQFPQLNNDQLLINKIMNENTPDDEYSIGFGYSRELGKRLSVGLDLGYSQLVQDFLLPADGTFFESPLFIFYWRNKSYYHMIQLSPKMQYLILDKKLNVGINIQAIGNVSFRKVIQEGNLSINKTEYFSTEIYPGLTIGYWRLHANIGYRALHWKYRDDAIANNELNPDSYNPFKMRFSLSYDILKW